MKTLKRIKGTLSYYDLQDIILDENLQEGDTLILNSDNFDDVVLDFKETYKESMTFPHCLLGVFIEENDYFTVPKYRVGIVKSDNIQRKDKFIYNTQDPVYRCAWCGNIVGDGGKVLMGEKRQRVVDYIENSKNPNIQTRNGNCCAQGQN